MLNTLTRTAAVAALCAAFASPAAAADYKVEIINKTGYAITEFYGSNKATNSWEEDILGEDVLPHNASVTIDFDDGTGHCLFDFLVKFEDGDTLTQEGVDVCTIGEFTFE
ncbi:hypothetical protein [Roseovarius dicentrarchi]|uniref:hypothetical protein n=1 Tax=Roseovarius dicentrarchi TaxID=2250573 RepID=UPI000DE8AD94|nr:hypothetical protein [Roseovarius dicentrarchi]